MKGLFHWLPRILGFVGIVVVSIFALDVSLAYDTTLERTMALIQTKYLIPTYLLITLTLIAWRFQRIGGLMYLITGLLIIFVLLTKQRYLLIILLVSLPMLLVGALFILDGLIRQLSKAVTKDTR